MKSIFELVPLAILITSLGCRPPTTGATTQDTPEGRPSLEQQLARVEQSILELKEELRQVKQEFATDEASARLAAVKLEVENAELKRERDELERRLAERAQSETEAMHALRAAQDMVAALMQERERMRAEQASKPAPRASADAQPREDQADHSQAVLKGAEAAVSQSAAPEGDPFAPPPVPPEAGQQRSDAERNESRASPQSRRNVETRPPH